MFKRYVQFIIAGLLTLPPGLAFAAGIVQLPATNQTSCFDANGNPRICAGTGEDGEKQAGVAWPATRFTDNNNGSVTDNLTGLVWSKHANAPSRALAGAANNNCPNAEVDMLWPAALEFIACLNAGNHAGFNDWRLPNLNELESMINSGVADTAAYLNANGFGFNAASQVRASQYWTSTSDASAVDLPDLSASSAWEMDLLKGDFPLTILKNGKTNGVWPVRGTSTGPAKLWRTGQAVCFDDLGDTRPCAGTGEDGEKLAGAAWPAPRFRPNTGATFALDQLTGLIWSTATMSPGPPAAACADTGLNLTWQDALNHVACLNTNAYLGRSDWRLPNRKELRSLVDYSRGKPALPLGHPFSDLDGLTYWSSTSDITAPSEAWTVSMFDGSLSGAVKASQLGGTLPAWPVSGPDLVPPALTVTQGNMITKVATQSIDGTVEAGASVMVAINGGAPSAATVNGTTWAFTIDPLSAGANNVVVTASDFSENQNTASISITFDAVAPALTIIPVTTQTNKKNQTISGTMETGATVTAKMGATNIPVTFNGTGWSCLVSGLVAGTNSITVTATDAAGNAAIQTANITFTAPDGIVSGGTTISVRDALKALRIAVGVVQPTTDDLLHGDVAPLGAPDDKIDVSDVVLILRKAVGLASF